MQQTKLIGTTVGIDMKGHNHLEGTLELSEIME